MTLLEDVLEQWRRTFKLSPAHSKVLAFACTSSSSVRDIALALGISENTVKTHIRALLQRTGSPSLGDAALRVLRECAGVFRVPEKAPPAPPPPPPTARAPRGYDPLKVQRLREKMVAKGLVGLARLLHGTGESIQGLG